MLDPVPSLAKLTFPVQATIEGSSVVCATYRSKSMLKKEAVEKKDSYAAGGNVD